MDNWKFLGFILIVFTNCVHTSEQNNPEENSLSSSENVLEQAKKIEENRIRCSQNNTQKVDYSTISSSEPVLKCSKTFDQILCWEDTLAGEEAQQDCPLWFMGFENAEYGKAKRKCLSNGTWMTKPNSNNTYTDYRACIENNNDKLLSSHLPKLKLIANIGSMLSLTSLILAIILLLGFKRLHCARNMLHVNLFASFLLFAILQLIKETFWVRSVGFPKDVLPEHHNSIRVVMNPNVSHWECKTLMTFYRYAESSNHVMVFCEALYLNTLVSVSTFSENNHFKFYILAGWICPIFWILPFIILMAIHGNPNSCWNSESIFSYLYVIPQVLLIFMNFGLFINIVRILKNKLRKNRLTESKQYRYKKLAKSTLILLPLFSIYYIAFSVWQPFVRGKLSIELELIRLYFEIICSSFQGLIISFIFCFFNSEVRNEIIMQIERKLLQRNPNMRRFSTMISKERNYSCASVPERNGKLSTANSNCGMHSMKTSPSTDIETIDRNNNIVRANSTQLNESYIRNKLTSFFRTKRSESEKNISDKNNNGKNLPNSVTTKSVIYQGHDSVDINNNNTTENGRIVEDNSVNDRLNAEFNESNTSKSRVSFKGVDEQSPERLNLLETHIETNAEDNQKL